MRIDLALEGVEARFEQQVLLLLKLDFQAEGVPDLESDTDHNRRAQPHQDLQAPRSEEHTSELQSHLNLVCRLLLEKKKTKDNTQPTLNLFLIIIHKNNS